MSSVEYGDLLTLKDLIARADLEPTLVDIYVEGRSDAAVVRGVMQHLGLDVGVFALEDRVGVSREEVEAYSSDYGARSKLIAAAAHASIASPSVTNLIFVIDADWAEVTGPQPVHRSALMMTDLPSMDHYFATEQALDRVIRRGLGIEASAKDVREDVESIVVGLAAARLSLQAIQVACISNWAKLIDFNVSPPRLDYAEVVRRSLNGIPVSSRPSGWEDAAEAASGYLDMLETMRHPGRGHDLAPALIATLRLKGRFAEIEVIEALMRASVTEDELLSFEFFASLAERARERLAVG